MCAVKRLLRNQTLRHTKRSTQDINTGQQALRLHQPAKNSISDNSNILWNSPSLGATLTFQKTTLVYHLKEKNRGSFTYFFWYSPLFEMRQKIAKIQCYCNVLNFNQFKA